MKAINRVAVITGAGSGIGLGVVHSLLASDFYCVVIDHNPELKSGIEALLFASQSGGQFLSEDSSDWATAERVFDSLSKKGFLPSLLINNVSPRHKVELFEETEETWNSSLDGSLKSCFTFSRELIRRMDVNISAQIINIGSVSSKFSSNQSPSYHAAKAGIEALTRYFALEVKLRHLQITVNCIRLGLIVQDRHRERYLDDSNKEYRNLVSKYLPGNQNPGTELDISGAVKFLASESARFINGSTLVLDGGASIQEQFSLILRNQ